MSIETKPTFQAGQPRVLFSEAGMLSSIFCAQYDVTPDDQRFIMIRQRRGDAAGALIHVLNAFEELVRRPPN